MGEKMEKSPRAFFTRHSKASYETYRKTMRSEEPQAPFDPEDQVTPDLPEAGVKLAREKAGEFFNELDPQSDAVIFVSSDEARALETANIYREEAHRRGFSVIQPYKTGTVKAGEIGQGEIRVVKNLSLGRSSRLANNVFVSDKQLWDVNWEKVDPAFKEKWDKAHAIVMADDQGSYGDNLFKHGEAVQQIMPEIETAEELYEKQFKKLVRLLNWGIEKNRQSGHERDIKIVAFGHENYMLAALDKYFFEHSIENCETIEFEITDQGIKGKFRGKEANIENDE